MQIINGVKVPAGTRKIFIDLGANDGSSTSYFLERSFAGDNVETQGGDSNSFLHGLGSTGDWDIVIFEANTNYTKELNQIRDNALSKGWAHNITIFGGTAIATHSGNITFILDTPVSGLAGSTTMAESASATGPHYTIPSVSILDLFSDMRIRVDDYVIVKMDIEGAEFDLLRHMIVHGMHRRIDVLAVEYHENNRMVLGRDRGVREKYQSIHRCLDWVMEEIKTIHMVHWSRR